MYPKFAVDEFVISEDYYTFLWDFHIRSLYRSCDGNLLYRGSLYRGCTVFEIRCERIRYYRRLSYVRFSGNFIYRSCDGNSLYRGSLYRGCTVLKIRCRRICYIRNSLYSKFILNSFLCQAETSSGQDRQYEVVALESQSEIDRRKANLALTLSPQRSKQADHTPAEPEESSGEHSVTSYCTAPYDVTSTL